MGIQHLSVVVPGVLVSLLPACAQSAPPASVRGFEVTSGESLEPCELRGYGSLGGSCTLYTAAGGKASWLVITCEDAQRAAVVQAKYLSDLRVLGGVSDAELAVGDRAIPVTRVEGQGWIAAARDGKLAHLVAADRGEDLAALLQAGKLTDAAQFTPNATVPMYLDSWDKYGFRFYYRPWETPPGKKWEDYSVMDEFDFARRLGDLGFIFWAEPNLADFADGLTNDIWWDWGTRAAERRGLPTIINTSDSAASWMINRFPDDRLQAAPEYAGSFYSPVPETGFGGFARFSWGSGPGKDLELSLLSKIVSDNAAKPNTLEYLEPHGELKHGDHDVFMQYGPAADVSFRGYLRGKYQTPAAVSRRWFGADSRLKSWDDIRVPEPASFLGWDETAISLRGPWRFAYEKQGEVELPDDCVLEAFDDSTWPQVTAPGNDEARLRKKEAAVLRRHFTVPAEWRARHPRVWLYLWDLNVAWDQLVSAHLNGEEVGAEKVRHPRPHWAAWEVTAVLRTGHNVLALRLPQGFLGYRVYLSPHPPVQYPRLSQTENARWVDFADWWGWARLQMARRGFEAIRQSDPNRSVICMAPNGFTTGIKELDEEYGGHFHNTGYMGGFFAQDLPMLMRGSDLPFSLEPGGPARDLPTFKRMMGYYLTEGVNAVHYYIHVGDILWNDDIRGWFEDNILLLRSFGKHHIPKAEVAVLLSDRVERLIGFPWGQDPNTNLGSGYWPWRFADRLSRNYLLDAVTDADFERGNADAYKVVLDTNTSIMDEAFVDQIEAWVRQGGVFVTYVQTGRHTPDQPDSWPISRLTGSRVLKVNHHGPTGSEEIETQTVQFAPGQDVFDATAWKPDELGLSNGLSLEKVAPECRDLMRWGDGTVAAGIRPLGKGFVINLGVKFARQVEWHGNPEAMQKLFGQILDWRGIKRIPAQASEGLLRYSVSNNGLFDVWTLSNETDKPLTADLTLDQRAAACRDLKTGRPVALPNADGKGRISGLELPAYETRIYLTPRAQLTAAPLEWLRLQRIWWRGTRQPSRVLPARAEASSLTLNERPNCHHQPNPEKQFSEVPLGER